jgi:hypothetical protein
VWDRTHSSRVFVHLLNSMSWKLVTGKEPPSTPRNAKDYANYGLPWFEFYSELGSFKATEETKKIKSAAQLQAEKGGLPLLPDNESVDVKPAHVVNIKTPSFGVKDGTW